MGDLRDELCLIDVSNGTIDDDYNEIGGACGEKRRSPSSNDGIRRNTEECRA